MHGDAAAFVDPEPFDFGFWSQYFFPTSARQATLRALRTALRPGGLLLAPLGADGDAAMTEPTSDAARDYALWRVVLDSWGIPERTPEQLTDEIAQAGFDDVRVIERDGVGPLVRATRPPR